MRKLQAVVVVWAVLSSTIASADRTVTCNQSSLIVSGIAGDRNGACSAVDEVLEYFAKGGIRAELQVTIRFQRAVFAEGIDELTKSRYLLPVSGVFRTDRNEIQIVEPGSPWKYQRRPWKLPWDQELADSILRHEIVHAVINLVIGSNRKKLPRAWHEALAYAVQIDLMNESLRARVLAQYPSEEFFSNTLQINDLLYGFDPDAFAVAAYKTYIREGKLDFLKRALALDLQMLDVSELLP